MHNLCGSDGLGNHRIGRRHPWQHIRHRCRVGETLRVIEHGTGEARVGCRFGQVRCLSLWAVVVIPAHCVVVLWHGRLIWECWLFICLGNGILRKPELVHVLIVAREILGRDWEPVLAIHVADGHAHALICWEIRQSEGTTERRCGSSSLHRKAVIVAGFVPAWRCQGTLAIETSGSGSRGL